MPELSAYAEQRRSKDIEMSADERQRLIDEIAVLRTRILALEHAADTDPLVPVYNRRAFQREIARAQTVMTRYDILSSIIFFDLNGFKAVNDRYGHTIGDQLLTMVGKELLSGVRDCDMAARIGGDEFGVLLFKTNERLAAAKAEALTKRIATIKISQPTGDIQISAAFGVAACHADDTVSEILDRADRAMYREKAGAV